MHQNDSRNVKSIPEKVLRKKFYLWRDNGIFYKAYKLCMDYYVNLIDMTNIFIDSSIIQNDNCNECIGHTYKLKSKKAIKINSIVTSDKITISHIISKPNVHDVNFIEPCLNQLSNNLNNSYHKPLYVVGDKGYTSNKIKLDLKQSNIILVYPNKSNAKNPKINYKYKSKLKERFKVEVSYAYTKKRYKRIKNPTDKKIINYNAFYMLSITMDIIRHIYDKRLFSKFNQIVTKSLGQSNNNFKYDATIHIQY